MELQATSQALELLANLEQTILETTQFLKRHGIEKSSTISPTSRAIFLSWPIERLESTWQTARRMLRVHTRAEAGLNFDLDDNAGLLDIALQELGVKIDPTFYTMINRSDILELYDVNHVQVFRSFNFFRLCNYSLDEVLAHQWFELYEREDIITNEILRELDRHITSTPTVAKWAVRDHLMRERFSQTRGVFVTMFRYFASVYSGPEQKAGYICTMAVKPVGENMSGFEFMRPHKGTQPLGNA